MPNRKELRQKGHDGSKKLCVEKYNFQTVEGGWINIVFGSNVDTGGQSYSYSITKLHN